MHECPAGGQRRTSTKPGRSPISLALLAFAILLSAVQAAPTGPGPAPQRPSPTTVTSRLASSPTSARRTRASPLSLTDGATRCSSAPPRRCSWRNRQRRQGRRSPLACAPCGDWPPVPIRARGSGSGGRPHAVARRRCVGHHDGRGADSSVNYLIGSDRSKWRIDVPAYARVRSRTVYPGVDLLFYGNGRQFEYDFIVAPGGDPRSIRIGFDGTRRGDPGAAHRPPR